MADETKEAKVEKVGGHAAEAAFDEAMSEWIMDHIRNSPISRDSESWNHLHSVLPHLKAALVKKMKN